MKLANRLCLLLIMLYQRTLSVWLGPCCRFYPSCSEYARQAYTKFGFFKASRKVLYRLARCGPWHSGGIDPV